MINNINNNIIADEPPQPPPPHGVGGDEPIINNDIINNHHVVDDVDNVIIVDAVAPPPPYLALYSLYQTHFTITAGDFTMVREAHENTSTTAVPAVVDEVVSFKEWLRSMVAENPRSGSGGVVGAPPTVTDFKDAISLRSRRSNAKAIDHALDAGEIFLKRLPSSPHAASPSPAPYDDTTDTDDTTPPTPLAPPRTPDTPSPPPQHASPLLSESEEQEGALIINTVAKHYIEKHRDLLSHDASVDATPGIANATSVAVYHVLMITGKDVMKKVLADLSTSSGDSDDGSGGGGDSASSFSPTLQLSMIYSLQSIVVYLDHLLRGCADVLDDAAPSIGTGDAQCSSSSSAVPTDPFVGFRSILRAVDRLSTPHSTNHNNDGMTDTPSLLHAPPGTLPEIELCLMKEDGLGWGGPAPKVDSDTHQPILLPPSDILRDLCTSWWYAQFPGLRSTNHHDEDNDDDNVNQDDAAAANGAPTTTTPARPVVSPPYVVSMLSNLDDPSTQLWARLVMIIHPPSAPSIPPTPPPPPPSAMVQRLTDATLQSSSSSSEHRAQVYTNQVRIRRLGIVLRMQPNFDHFTGPLVPTPDNSPHRTTSPSDDDDQLPIGDAAAAAATPPPHPPRADIPPLRLHGRRFKRAIRNLKPDEKSPFLEAIESCIVDACRCILASVEQEVAMVSKLPVKSRDKANRTGALLLACRTVLQTSDVLGDATTRLLLLTDTDNHSDHQTVNNNTNTDDAGSVAVVSPPRAVVRVVGGTLKEDTFTILERYAKYTSQFRILLGVLIAAVCVVCCLLGEVEQYLPLSAEDDITYASLVWMQATTSSSSTSFKDEVGGEYETMGEWAVHADANPLYAQTTSSWSPKQKDAERKRIPPLPTVCREVESSILSSHPLLHHASITPILPTLIAACEVGQLRALAKTAFDGKPAYDRWLNTIPPPASYLEMLVPNLEGFQVGYQEAQALVACIIEGISCNSILYSPEYYSVLAHWEGRGGDLTLITPLRLHPAVATLLRTRTMVPISIHEALTQTGPLFQTSGNFTSSVIYTMMRYSLLRQVELEVRKVVADALLKSHMRGDVQDGKGAAMTSPPSDPFAAQFDGIVLQHAVHNLRELYEDCTAAFMLFQTSQPDEEGWGQAQMCERWAALRKVCTGVPSVATNITANNPLIVHDLRKAEALCAVTPPSSRRSNDSHVRPGRARVAVRYTENELFDLCFGLTVGRPSLNIGFSTTTATTELQVPFSFSLSYVLNVLGTTTAVIAHEGFDNRPGAGYGPSLLRHHTYPNNLTAALYECLDVYQFATKSVRVAGTPPPRNLAMPHNNVHHDTNHHHREGCPLSTNISSMKNNYYNSPSATFPSPLRRSSSPCGGGAAVVEEEEEISLYSLLRDSAWPQSRYASHSRELRRARLGATIATIADIHYSSHRSNQVELLSTTSARTFLQHELSQPANMSIRFHLVFHARRQQILQHLTKILGGDDSTPSTVLASPGYNLCMALAGYVTSESDDTTTTTTDVAPVSLSRRHRHISAATTTTTTTTTRAKRFDTLSAVKPITLRQYFQNLLFSIVDSALERVFVAAVMDVIWSTVYDCHLPNTTYSTWNRGIHDDTVVDANSGSGICSSTSLIDDYHVYFASRVLIPLVAAMGGCILFLDQLLLLLIVIAKACSTATTMIVSYNARSKVINDRLRVWAVVRAAYITAAHNIIMTYGANTATKVPPALSANILDVTALTLSILEISRGLSHVPICAYVTHRLTQSEHVCHEANHMLRQRIMVSAMAVVRELDAVMKYHFGDVTSNSKTTVPTAPTQQSLLALFANFGRAKATSSAAASSSPASITTGSTAPNQRISEGDMRVLFTDRAHCLLHSGLIASTIHCLRIGRAYNTTMSSNSSSGGGGDSATLQRGPSISSRAVYPRRHEQVYLLKSIALSRRERASIAIEATHTHIQTLFGRLDAFTTTRVRGHIDYVAYLTSIDVRLGVVGGPAAGTHLMPTASHIRHFIRGWITDALTTITNSSSSSAAAAASSSTPSTPTVSFPSYNHFSSQKVGGGDLTGRGGDDPDLLFTTRSYMMSTARSSYRHNSPIYTNTASLLSTFDARDSLLSRLPSSLSDAASLMNATFVVSNPLFNEVVSSGGGGGRSVSSDRNALTIHVAALALIHDAFVAIGALKGERWKLNHPDYALHDDNLPMHVDAHHHAQRKMLVAFLHHVRSLAFCVRPFPSTTTTTTSATNNTTTSKGTCGVGGSSNGVDDMAQSDRDALRMYYPFLTSSPERRVSSSTTTSPLPHHVIGLEYPTLDELHTEFDSAKLCNSVGMARGGILYYLHCLSFLKSSLLPRARPTTSATTTAATASRVATPTPTPRSNVVGDGVGRESSDNEDGNYGGSWFVRVGQVGVDGTHIATSFPRPSWCLRVLHRSPTLFINNNNNNTQQPPFFQQERDTTSCSSVMDVVDDCIRVLQEDYLRGICGSFLYRYKTLQSGVWRQAGSPTRGYTTTTSTTAPNPAVAAVNCGVAMRLGIPEGAAAEDDTRHSSEKSITSSSRGGGPSQHSTASSSSSSSSPPRSDPECIAAGCMSPSTPIELTDAADNDLAATTTPSPSPRSPPPMDSTAILVPTPTASDTPTVTAISSHSPATSGIATSTATLTTTNSSAFGSLPDSSAAAKTAATGECECASEPTSTFNTPSTPLPPSTSHVQLGDDDNIVGAAAPALDVGNADDENDDPAESTDDEKDGQDVREGPDEADGSENDAAVNNAEDVPPATPTITTPSPNSPTTNSTAILVPTPTTSDTPTVTAISSHSPATSGIATSTATLTTTNSSAFGSLPDSSAVVHERGANPTTFHSSPSPPPPSPNIAVGAAASHSVVDGDGCYDRDEDHKYESLAFRGDTPPSLDTSETTTDMTEAFHSPSPYRPRYRPHHSDDVGDNDIIDSDAKDERPSSPTADNITGAACPHNNRDGNDSTNRTPQPQQQSSTAPSLPATALSQEEVGSGHHLNQSPREKQ